MVIQSKEKDLLPDLILLSRQKNSPNPLRQRITNYALGVDVSSDKSASSTEKRNLCLYVKVKKKIPQLKISAIQVSLLFSNAINSFLVETTESNTCYVP